MRFSHPLVCHLILPPLNNTPELSPPRDLPSSSTRLLLGSITIFVVMFTNYEFSSEIPRIPVLPIKVS